MAGARQQYARTCARPACRCCQAARMRSRSLQPPAHLVAALAQAAEEVQPAANHLSADVVAHVRPGRALAPVLGGCVVQQGGGAACGVGRARGWKILNGTSGTSHPARQVCGRARLMLVQMGRCSPARQCRQPARARSGGLQVSPSPTTTSVSAPCLLGTRPAATSPSGTGMSGSVVQVPAAAAAPCKQRRQRKHAGDGDPTACGHGGNRLVSLRCLAPQAPPPPTGAHLGGRQQQRCCQKQHWVLHKVVAGPGRLTLSYEGLVVPC